MVLTHHHSTMSTSQTSLTCYNYHFRPPCAPPQSAIFACLWSSHILRQPASCLHHRAVGQQSPHPQQPVWSLHGEDNRGGALAVGQEGDMAGGLQWGGRGASDCEGLYKHWYKETSGISGEGRGKIMPWLFTEIWNFLHMSVVIIIYIMNYYILYIAFHWETSGISGERRSAIMSWLSMLIKDRVGSSGWIWNF